MTAVPQSRRRSPGAIIGALGCALLTAVLAACGSSGSPAASPTATTLGSTGLSPAQLLPAAKKEGTVVWYTTFSSKDVSPMIQAFNQAYPGITVQPLRLSADKLPPKVITEQRGGKYNADVITGDGTQVNQLLQAGALAPYNTPGQPPLPSGLSLPAGYQGVVYLVTTVIAYNPSAVRAHHLTAPTSVADLAKPQWKGLFSVDPGAINWYQSLIASLGHSAALNLIKALGNNSPRLVTSHTQALTQVQAGDPVATATAYGYKASSMQKKTPTQIAFVNVSPLPTALTMADLAKNAPHPSAARLFLDWLLSRAGQQAVVSITNHTSLLSGVGNDPAVWDPAKWQPAWAQPVLSAATYNQYSSEYRAALHAS